MLSLSLLPSFSNLVVLQQEVYESVLAKRKEQDRPEEEDARERVERGRERAQEAHRRNPRRRKGVERIDSESPPANEDPAPMENGGVPETGGTSEAVPKVTDDAGNLDSEDAAGDPMEE